MSYPMCPGRADKVASPSLTQATPILESYLDSRMLSTRNPFSVSSLSTPNCARWTASLFLLKSYDAHRWPGPETHVHSLPSPQGSEILGRQYGRRCIPSGEWGLEAVDCNLVFKNELHSVVPFAHLPISSALWLNLEILTGDS